MLQVSCPPLMQFASSYAAYMLNDRLDVENIQLKCVEIPVHVPYFPPLSFYSFRLSCPRSIQILLELLVKAPHLTTLHHAIHDFICQFFSLFPRPILSFDDLSG